MQSVNLQELINHPAADAFSRSSARLEHQVRQAQTLSGAERTARLKSTAQEFESLFVAYLLKSMRETIEESGLFEGSLGKSVYSELFDQELARLMAQRGVLGISDLLLRQLGDSVAPEGAAAGPAAAVAAPPPEGDADAAEEDIPEFLMPVHATVSSSFGIRRDPFTREVRFHKGLDLAAPEGTDVLAALGGRVVNAGYEKGYGRTVVVQHEKGYQTRYAHLGTVAVREGDILEGRQLLGTVGSSGRSTGPHLHFEITQYDRRIDPRAAVSD